MVHQKLNSKPNTNILRRVAVVQWQWLETHNQEVMGSSSAVYQMDVYKQYKKPILLKLLYQLCDENYRFPNFEGITGFNYFC